MPNPQTRIFVTPGAGRKTPLPIPGSNAAVPAEGRFVLNSFAAQRLLRCGDLVAGAAPAAAPGALSAAAAATTNKKEG